MASSPLSSTATSRPVRSMNMRFVSRNASIAETGMFYFVRQCPALARVEEAGRVVLLPLVKNPPQRLKPPPPKTKGFRGFGGGKQAIYTDAQLKGQTNVRGRTGPS